jgi:glycosyltransferase involved in cell wall biosynthesis
VSLVIPVRDERAAIASCLAAVLGQEYPPSLLEVIVVDAGSTDGSRELVEDRARRDGRIRLLHNPTGSIPAGLNVGIRAARGDVIARVDARARLAPDYVAIAVDLLRTTGAANVGGPVRSETPTAVGQALALAWASRFGLGGAATRYRDAEEQWTDTVYLGVFPRDVLDAVGPYDETIPQDEDTELNYRIRARGGKILLSPRLRTTYLNVPSLGRIARKNFQFGLSKARVWRRHPGMVRGRHLVPPAFVGALGGGPVLGLLHPLGLELWLGLVGLYATACLAVSAVHAARTRQRAALLLPVVFPLLHVTWGAGFLWGLVGLVVAPAPASPSVLEPARVARPETER